MEWIPLIKQTLDTLPILCIALTMIRQYEQNGAATQLRIGLEVPEKLVEGLVEPADVVQALVMGVLLDVAHAKEACVLVDVHKVACVVEVDVEY